MGWCSAESLGTWSAMEVCVGYLCTVNSPRRVTWFPGLVLLFCPTFLTCQRPVSTKVHLGLSGEPREYFDFSPGPPMDPLLTHGISRSEESIVAWQQGIRLYSKALQNPGNKGQIIPLWVGLWPPPEHLWRHRAGIEPMQEWACRKNSPS